MSEFTISAGPSTDIWKKPPTTNVFNAPYKTQSSAPLPIFKSASLTFTAPYTTQYDQAGLLLIFHPPSSSNLPPKWLKTGIEFYNSTPRLSTVCCDNYADWSVAPLPNPSQDNKPVEKGEKSVTVKVIREQDENGVGWWVYHVPQGAEGKKEEYVPLREVAWIFGMEKPEEWRLEVAAAVARPNKDVEGELEGRFWDFEVEWE